MIVPDGSLKLVAVGGDETRRDAAGARDADLLAEHRPEGELVAVDVPGGPEPGRGRHRRAQHGIGTERLADRHRVGVEIEEPPEAPHRGGEVAQVLESELASQVAIGRRIDGDLGYRRCRAAARGVRRYRPASPSSSPGTARAARNPKICAGRSGGR